MRQTNLMVFFLLVFSGIVKAEWTVSGEGSEVTWYVDLDSARKTNFGIKVWVLEDHKVEQPNKSLSSKLQQQYDCQANKVLLESATDFSSYMGRGQVVDNYTNSTMTWKDILPGTIGDSTLQLVCSKFKRANSQ